MGHTSVQSLLQVQCILILTKIPHLATILPPQFHHGLYFSRNLYASRTSFHQSSGPVCISSSGGTEGQVPVLFPNKRPVKKISQSFMFNFFHDRRKNGPTIIGKSVSCSIYHQIYVLVETVGVEPTSKTYRHLSFYECSRYIRISLCLLPIDRRPEQLVWLFSSFILRR